MHYFFIKKRTQLLCPGKYTRARVSFTSFTPVSFRPIFHPPAHLVRHPHTARPAHIAYTRTRETPHRAESLHCPLIRPLSRFYPPHADKILIPHQENPAERLFCIPCPPRPGSFLALYALLAH